jgi:hypothetical protein
LTKAIWRNGPPPMHLIKRATFEQLHLKVLTVKINFFAALNKN